MSSFFLSCYLCMLICLFLLLLSYCVSLVCSFFFLSFCCFAIAFFYVTYVLPSPLYIYLHAFVYFTYLCYNSYILDSLIPWARCFHTTVILAASTAYLAIYPTQIRATATAQETHFYHWVLCSWLYSLWLIEAMTKCRPTIADRSVFAFASIQPTLLMSDSDPYQAALDIFEATLIQQGTEEP